MEKTLFETAENALLAAPDASELGRIAELPGPLQLSEYSAGHAGAADFVLVLNRGTPWAVRQDRHVSVATGDAVLLDARSPHHLDLIAPFDVARMGVPGRWLDRWVPNAARHTGDVISKHAQWGCPVTLFMEQLAIGEGPWSGLPLPAVLDQFGVLLALHSDAEWGERHVGSDFDAIRRTIADRCFEQSLDVRAIASSLLISDRTLHRVLAREGKRFGPVLAEARVAVAKRMLESAIFNRLTTAEIGTRAGFKDPSHFARAFRRAFGVSPAQARRGQGPA